MNKKMIWDGAVPNGTYAGKKGPVTPEQKQGMSDLDAPLFGSNDGTTTAKPNPNKTMFYKK